MVLKLGVTRILAFGDSMTAGTTNPPFTFRAIDAGLAQSYPYKLQALLAARYTTQTIAVLNAGIAGKQVVANDERSRLAHEIALATPDLVLLMEGANDLNNIAPLPGTNAGVDATTGGLEDMVRDTLARGLPVFVATLPPQRENGRNAGGFSLLPKYNNDLKAMATKKGATVVDVNAQFPLALIGQDGLHPTEPGYDRMAEIFLDAIKQKYETTASSSLRP